MAELADLRTLTKNLRTLLAGDVWSVEDLAKAKVKDLTKYKGVGKTTAELIIDEAQRLLEQEARAAQQVVATVADEDPAGGSARVRRIRGAG